MKNKVKQLTIDESKWTTGTLYEKGSYCALGHLCKALGYEDETLEGVPSPKELSEYPEWMDTELTEEQEDEMSHGIGSLYDNTFQVAVWEVNDSTQPRETKKNKLKQLFKIVEINLHFKNSDKSIMK